MSVIGNDACPRDHCMTCALKLLTLLGKQDIHYTWKCMLRRHKKAPKQPILMSGKDMRNLIETFRKSAKKSDKNIFDNAENFSKSFISRFRYLTDKSYETNDPAEFGRIREEIIGLVMEENDRRRDRPGVA